MDPFIRILLLLVIVMYMLPSSTVGQEWQELPHPPIYYPLHTGFREVLPIHQLNPIAFNPQLPTRGRPPANPSHSCQKRCQSVGHNEYAPCQCNVHCLEHGDCCPDYERFCLSCAGKCFSNFVSRLPCQCNRQCGRFENCCEDFEDECGGSEGGVSDLELANLSEELLSLDVNNVASHVTINLQETTVPGGVDKASSSLLVVAPEAFESPTLSKLVGLHDNYIPDVRAPEVVTPEEVAEEKEFFDAILSTPVMERAQQFLNLKGLVKGDFRAALAQIWFGLYSRDRGTLGSSGFEHIFLGELKNGISGFHNWAFFSSQEANSNLNYNGYISALSLGSKGSIIQHTFNWLGKKKKLGSMFIGTSPEFEMAIYTVCWYARPNARCPVTLNEHKLRIQTYEITSGGKKFVASAYPDIS